MPSHLLPIYAPQILQQMVMEKAVGQEARRLGLGVSTEELASELRVYPQFISDGKFIGHEQYQSFIKNRYGMSVPEFENRFRTRLLEQKLSRVVTAGVTVSDQEVAREFHRRNDKLRVQYALLKTDRVRSTVAVSPAEVDEFFKRDASRYQVPERRQFRLLFVETASLKDTVSVSEQDLQSYYKRNLDLYRIQNRVRASHILLKTLGKEPDEIETVRKRVEAILERLRNGEDFARLARRNSDDAATTPRGGDLGWIVRGQTVPEFEKAAFSLEPGALSEVIQTQYGFHIVKVHEHQRARQKPLEEVRNQILPRVTQQKAERAAEDVADKTQNTLRENPGTLQAVAKQLGLPVLETGLVRRGDPLPKIGASAALGDALFSATLKENEVTPVVTVPGGLVVAFSGAHQPGASGGIGGGSQTGGKRSAQ